ncbi:MAG: hypothetical protein WCJ75_09140 [Desulfomonile sp.]
MRSDQQHGGSGRFLVKQLILLLITVSLMVLFTIPLLKTFNSAMNPGELVAKVDKANMETAGIQNEVDAARSMMLMGAGDEEAQEKLKKQVEELQRQMALKELQNKNLQDQMALVQTVLQLVNSKSAAAPPPEVEFWHKLADLATKVLGCIASLFSGSMFFLAWWRKRGQPQEPAAS